MNLIKKQLPGTLQEVFLRPGTSDKDLFRVLIGQDEYGYIEFLQEPHVIIDAGANIGLSAVYFAQKYPHAKIYAIEPETENFAMLKRNTASNPNITPVFGALMAKSGCVEVIDSGTGVLGYQVRYCEGADGQNTVPCLTIEDICRKYGLHEIDLLKIDIEGAEKDIFSHPCPWLCQVKAIVIELHERITMGCNRAVFNAMDPYFPLEWIGGENFYFVRDTVAKPCIPDIFKGVQPERLAIERVWEMESVLSAYKKSLSQALEPVCHRIETLEELQKKVNALELLSQRVDTLEKLYGRMESLEKFFEEFLREKKAAEARFDLLQHAIEELQEEN